MRRWRSPCRSPASLLAASTATTVTWSARDDSNNVGTANQSVQVVDTTPPNIAAPPACRRSTSAPSARNAPAVFPLGTTTIKWTATDGSGNSSTATQTVTVVDTTPPTLTVSVTPSTLWPPNHKLVAIHANIVTTDICDSTPTVTLLSITSSEPDDGLGDGDTAGDIQGAAIGTDDRDFLLRAERSGRGSGRVYTIVYESRDDSGNATVREATVSVPRNQ